MSTIYTIQEHLKITNTENTRNIIPCMNYRLCEIGALMLSDMVRYLDIHMSTDKKSYQFDNLCPNESYKELLDAMYDAQELDFLITYEYKHTIDNTISMLVKKNDLTQLFSELDKDDEVPEAVFYSVYVEADNAETVGTYCAYGYKDGNYYYGNIPYRPIDEFPNDGLWSNPQASALFAEEIVEGLDYPKIEEVCKELCALSSADTLIHSKDTFTFCLNNLEIHSRKEFERYAALAQQLINLTNGACFIQKEYIDYSDPDPRIICIHLHSSRKPDIELMEP